MKKIQKTFTIDTLASKAKLSSEEMQNVKGGFACYCNGVYKGEFDDVSACASACGLVIDQTS